MKKNRKNESSATKKQLEMLVQDFLEADVPGLIARCEDKGAIDDYFERLSAVLIGQEFWMDEIDPEDFENIDKRAFVLETYNMLLPLWEQIKKSLIDYNENITPIRNNIKQLKEAIGKDKSADYYQYKDLLDVSGMGLDDKFYNISMELSVSFDNNIFNFYKRKINIVSNFLDLISGLPTHILSQCRHCNKFIVKTRSDKQYCPGCAVKKYQKEQWKRDPEGMRQKEKIRYRTKRKKT